MSDRLSVTVLPDGPYKLQNVESLRYCGEQLETGREVYLCRCGQSSNAPFCDGTHRTVDFDGSNAGREPKEVRVWEGRTVRTRFNPNTCMHVFYCKPLKELRERELAGDVDAAEEIMKVVDTCPSGALSWERKEELPAPARPRTRTVEVIEGGEVRVQCVFDIDAARNADQPEDRATLCRCGLSKNKPWCDGRHKARTDFR